MIDLRSKRNWKKLEQTEILRNYEIIFRLTIPTKKACLN